MRSPPRTLSGCCGDDLGLLRVCPPELEVKVGALLQREDNYDSGQSAAPSNYATTLEVDAA
jgi:hypothetical protein